VKGVPKALKYLMSFPTAGSFPDVSRKIKIQELYDIHLQLSTTELKNWNALPTKQHEQFD
jgi:hypothetical protein